MPKGSEKLWIKIFPRIEIFAQTFRNPGRESNPGPLDSKATALPTDPLGRKILVPKIYAHGPGVLSCRICSFLSMQIGPTLSDCTSNQGLSYHSKWMRHHMHQYSAYSAKKNTLAWNTKIFGPKIFFPSGSVGRAVAFESKGPGFDSLPGFLKVWAKFSIRGRILVHSFPEHLGIK